MKPILIYARYLYTDIDKCVAKITWFYLFQSKTYLITNNKREQDNCLPISFGANT